MNQQHQPEFRSNFLREVSTRLQQRSEALTPGDRRIGLQIASYEDIDHEGLHATLRINDCWFELLCSENNQVTFAIRSALDETLFKKLVEIPDVIVPRDEAVIVRNFEASIDAGWSLRHDSVYVDGMETFDRIDAIWRSFSHKVVH